MEDLSKQLELQNKIMSLVKDRQVQITEIKLYFDKSNTTKLYKDIIKISKEIFEEMYNKTEYRQKYIQIITKI